MLWFVLPVILLILAGLGYAAYLQYQEKRTIAADKIRFAQAERDIAEISTEIQKVTKKPIKVENRKSCTRPSVKIEEAQLSCTASADLFYEITDEMEASNLRQMLRAMLSQEIAYLQEKSTSSSGIEERFEKIDTAQYQKLTGYGHINDKYINTSSRMDCSLNYILYKASAPPYSDYVYDDKKELILLASADCNDKSSVLVYPMSE